ncbi:MAG: hypothetical protein ACI4TI_00830, partial [Christensenellales bacterium]
MKRGFIIISIFLVLIGLCIWEDVYLSTNLQILNDKAVELASIVRVTENVDEEIVSNKIKELD